MDAHIHSKFSRATSKNMDLENLSEWARYKGIDILGTGDFTHPFWSAQLKEKLEDVGGLFKLKENANSPFFILTAEISCIYSQDGKGRRIHLVIFAPSISDVEKINQRLSKIGNLYSDGRPILGISAYDVTKIILEVSPESFIVPAHIWTPWFSLFGSNSGYNTVKECFKDLTSQIFALETGLSSDPPMNWRLSQLDNYSLISNSDAHSPANLGREATVFEVADKDNLSFSLIKKMLKEGNISYTIEFFPEEGKYHYDGHRNCDVNISPDEAKKKNNKCPKCGRDLTIGVMHRVIDLADRKDGFKPEKAPSFKSLLPLREIIAESLKQKTGSRQVETEYMKIVKTVSPELPLLLDFSQEKLTGKVSPEIINAIQKIRQGKVEKIPGFDGVYGIIKVKEDSIGEKSQQKTLF